MVYPSHKTLREALARDGTLIIGSHLVLLARTALDPGWWAPWIVLSVILVVLRFGTRLRKGVWWLGIPLVGAAAILLLGRPSLQSTHSRHSELDAQKVLVCAGDSLTSGVDANIDSETYVARLRSRLDCTVINAGRANDQTADLLARFDEDAGSAPSSVILILIGGNDYLEGTPRSRFAPALDELVRRATATGARIVLVEVPSGIVWDPYAGVYRQVARSHGATLVPGTQLRLWFCAELLFRQWLPNPLTLDGIHLSPNGATRVADWLEPYVRQALAEG